MQWIVAASTLLVLGVVRVALWPFADSTTTGAVSGPAIRGRLVLDNEPMVGATVTVGDANSPRYAGTGRR